MSRHNRRVPASFYHRFAVDARNFAGKFADAKLISVLEGGYSDRALISGGLAHLCGLIDCQSLGVEVKEEWWNTESLTLVGSLRRPLMCRPDLFQKARKNDQEETRRRESFTWRTRRKMAGTDLCPFSIL